MNLINVFISYMIALVIVILTYRAIKILALEAIDLVGRITRYFATGGSEND